MKYGLIGEKLSHSFSKEIHERIADYQYELKELSLDEFDGFMKKKDFLAINVTIPYKEKVIPYLDYIDETALKIKAVNTIVNNNGKLYGYNTDYYGLKSLIIKNDIEIKNKKVLILGTGGTSKTTSIVLNDLSPKEIIFVSRTKKDNVITYLEAINNHSDANVIINTTPCGMYPNNNDIPIDLNNFNQLEAVIDVIYNPLKTKLIIQAQNKKLKTATGLYMLVSQAVYASSKFINKEVDIKLIDNIYDNLLKQKQNIVLIGMPSCGKTTIGKKLINKLNKEFIDTDLEIEKIINMPISSYLTKDNETDFRNIEHSVIKEISKYNNKIISTGGGIIKNEENINLLKQNGIIIFINRPFNKLITTSSRPLSSSYNDLQKLYEERIPLYHKYADIIVNNDKNIKDVILEILNKI